MAEAQAQLKDQEAWALERARMEAEVGRAREMEKEAYDRYEVCFWLLVLIDLGSGWLVSFVAF